VKRHIIQKHLIDPFAQVPLENFDRFTLQLHLKGLAKTNCRDTVLQLRAYLRDIFAEAVEQDFLVKDPARKVAVPAQLRESDKTTSTWEQLRSALGRLEFRDRLLMTLEMTNALRPGELFALRWSCFNHAESTMRLKETVYKGSLRPWGKTRKSLCVIPLSEELVPELWLWKQECADSSPEAFIFPNEDGGFVDPGNYLKRGSQETGKRNRFAKADLPGNLAHDCYAGPNKGYRQKRAGHVEAQSHRDHDRRLHAGDAGRGTGDSAGNLRGTYGVTKPWKRSKSLTPSDTKREIGVSVSC
jgi:integrase